ncbi:unnamed protein product [[Candida] boidinii]|uniref:Unnamed protein product n=1 Tax=Candida boidinii TaxID=5477 RepID=A0A9W6T100_CANBO|nr:unnamed protein product [[Candida] boidinii]
MFFEFFSDRKRFSDTKIFNDRVKNDLSVIADEHDFKFKLVFYLTSAPNILKNDDSEIKDAFTTFHNKYKNIDDFGKIFDSISQKEENKNGVNLKGFAVTENKRFPGYTALLSFFQKDIAETKNLSNETQEKLKTYALNVAKERYQAMVEIFDKVDFYKKCLAKDDAEMTFKRLANFDSQCQGMEREIFKFSDFNKDNWKSLPKVKGTKLVDDTHQNILRKLKDIAITLSC